MECSMEQTSLENLPHIESSGVSDVLSSQVVSNLGTSDRGDQIDKVVLPIGEQASTRNIDMVPVLAEDHPLATEFHRLRQQILEQNPDYFTSDLATEHQLMPALNSTDKFVYNKLQPNEIRLIALHPGSGSQDLICSLTTVPLQIAKLNEYEALSYAWGAPGELFPVRCNNSEQSQTLEGEAYMLFPLHSSYSITVSKNLRDALLRLRVPDDFRMLWIDAICINQDDIQERSEQVKLMADIYENADNVIIWLGEENAETSIALEGAKLIIKMKAKLLETYPKPDELPIGVTLWKSPKRSPFYVSEESWRALCRFFTRRSWFRRVWVIQEVVMADKAIVVCGGHTMAWSDLHEVCNMIITFRMFDYDRALVVVSGSQDNGFEDPAVIIQQTFSKGNMRNVRLALQQHHDGETISRYKTTFRLESLVANVRSAEATDPKDKVYGLWSMAVARDSLPPVDYASSVRQVYVAAATYWVTNSIHIPENLSSFFSCIQMANPQNCLPSWVPDWSVPNVAPSLDSGGEYQFRAAGDTKAEMSFVGTVPETGPAFSPSEQWFLDFKQREGFSPTDYFVKKDEKLSLGDGDCLSAKGVRVFKIIAAERRRTLSHKRSHAEKISRFNDPYPTTDKSYLEVYPLVMNPRKPGDLRCDIKPGDPGLWAFKERFERQEADKKPSSEEGHEKSCRTQEDLDSSLPELFGSIGSMTGPYGTFTRSFFVTSDGFMGLGPSHMAAGDEVCLLHGTLCPLVIRPTSNKGRYTLVGECYVYGIMHGEAMESLPPGKVEQIIFN